MPKIVKVTESDVQRARLVVSLNESLGKPTAAGIRKIAQAKPLLPRLGQAGTNS